ncbi:MAG: CPBP family intramembrane metalloprotease [Patescibacteria group bacterium]|jgi:membrane protease YdiL (CAAX protease family)|nr:CPBP family intramembrane metalloprotease [Patescibacteria group bacterium]
MPESIAQVIAISALILLYGTTLARLVPKKWHFILNIFITLLAIIVGFSFGLNTEQMGLSPSSIKDGFVVAVVASLIIIIATIVVAIIPIFRKFFLGENLANANGKLLTFEAAIRIPFSTALVEEILFRGVLLGLLLSLMPTLQALILSSILFGLWHIFPTIKSLEQNDVTTKIVKDKKGRQGAGVVGAVIVTGFAGFIFGWLRILAGSVLAPWLVHWSINASGVLGIAVARKLTKFKQT